MGKLISPIEQFRQEILGRRLKAPEKARLWKEFKERINIK